MMKENIAIASLTTMRLGGAARYVAEVGDIDGLKKTYDFARENGLPVFVLGSGANVIGRDEGFEGVIIVDKFKGIEVVKEENGELVVKAAGGEVWDDVVKFTTELGYSGIEAMSAIPGTAGAAPVQNIGAYGQDISQVVQSVEAFDAETEEVVMIPKEKLGFSYRRSIFNSGEGAGRYFIIAVVLRLKKGELEPPFYTSLQKYVDDNRVTDFSPENIRRMVAEIRAMKLPDPESVASAGSFFKNIYLSDEEAEKARERGIPVWDYSEGMRNVVNSGWLIENAGLKGKMFHGFRVSDKAALVLINESAKSYADLEKAKTEIVKAVQEKFGFKLEQEPVEIK
jgi:UDP-N-acetylmuramate dehydrogenase